ncbi:MAG: thiamine biosynthesis protein ThiS [Nitrosopumilaceae archaeon]|nr:thiamine biosynthesis protein ThiS [Nitrosopumilaceae archaeon]NIT99493.1 thiamine biosynthesis protein ThiS [Nitrosopumilaceae archaeon]NIU85852.1 thiamine biosynthesis protein ThiS [Nitrosopumilaceae archaeon]NIV64709.1 thiamine biosynthesis protein ThiS [Nitrosopumilaceae archaeon]NIX60096.1 thiamine biosynthesis protein ThiS [Nitrosopumilaceae archaeon]
MIKIKLLGGAKKSIAKNEVFLNQDNVTINDVFEFLHKIKPQDTPDLDLKNMLIAVNGVDSSALDGGETKLKKDDVISIIPVIHGGSRIEFVIGKNNVYAIEIIGKKVEKNFLDSVREQFPNLLIQTVSSKFVLNKLHLYKILKISIESQKTNTMLSNKIETDILLRFAGTTQISQAISKAGMKKGNDFVLIAIGKKSDLNLLHQKLADITKKSQLKNNSEFLENEFHITKKQIQAVVSKHPLEDLLAERSTVLF